MNNYSYILLFISLFVISNVSATPQKFLSDKDIKLAMVDLSRQGFVLHQKEAALNKRQKPIFPRNCLKWNAWQINQKAKPFELTINKYSRQYGVDSNLVKSVITAESCFRVKALSHAGAQGLMQLIPDTAKRFGVKNSYKPEQNIRGGVKYLKFLLKRYQGDLKKTIAAYNAGEGKVDRYKGIPPYKETKNYVKNVLNIYALLRPKSKNRSKALPKKVYQPPKLGQKPGRHGWQFNRRLAPHLYKK